MPDAIPGLDALLRRAGLNAERCVLHALPGGANNRAYRVESPEKNALLKVYFRHPDDPRDRLGAEFGFSTFAWERGIRCIPQPFAADFENALGLYQFIEGDSPQREENVGTGFTLSADTEADNMNVVPTERFIFGAATHDADASPQRDENNDLTPASLTLGSPSLYMERGSGGEVKHAIFRAAVQAALDFYLSLNQHQNHPDAEKLPNGSEACFSTADHLRTVERRIQRLMDMQPENDVEHDAAHFIQRELIPVWREVRAGIPEDETPIAERCISPSDFGFHNAILTPAGHYIFIDFEYAGWDDPAKLVCDFFCQPRIPVPMEFYPGFVDAIAAGFADPDELRQRIAALLPVYGVKWCCIMLNDFLPTSRARRQFAFREKQPDYAEQLQKARNALQRVLEEWT